MDQPAFDPLLLLQKYHNLQLQPQTADGVISILLRYNLAWLTPTYAEDKPLPRQKVSLAGNAFHSTLLSDVYRTPLLYRLAFLKQLSTVAMVTHLDATHTRLTHALGTAEIASLVLNHVKINSPELPGFDVRWEKACLFYCFLHDAFHGPMGHSLDMMRSALGMSLGEKLDDDQFKRSLRAAIAGAPDFIAAQLRMAASRVWLGHEVELLKAVDILADPATVMQEAPKLFFLRDIVTSALDADRLDYLIRDAELLESTDLRPYFSELVKTAIALPENGLTRLAFAVEQKPAVERALGMRRRLYSTHYESAPKLILDDMLCHGIYYVLSDVGLTGQAERPISESVREDAIRQLLLLTDGDLLPALGELRADPAAYDLLLRFLQRRYFVEFHRVALRYSETESIIAAFKGWMEEISAVTDRLTSARSHKNYPLAADKARDLPLLREVTEAYFASIDNQEQVLVYGFQKLLEGTFEDRVAFERDTWGRFCTEYDPDEDIRLAYLEQETGSATRDKILELDRRPPLHITTTSFFDVTSRYDVMAYLKEGGAADRRGVLLYERMPSEYVCRREFVRTEILEEEPVLPLLLSAPATLVALAAEKLRKAALEELRACGWLWQLVAKGTQWE
jgi:HD superfamily phosphohydrolase